MRESSLLASRNIAYMCKCFVISSCGVNSEEMIKDLRGSDADEAFLRDVEKTGGTCIIDPATNILAGPMAGDEEGIIYACADFDACIRGRMVHDFAGHYNRPDIYRLLVNNRPSALVGIAEDDQLRTDDASIPSPHDFLDEPSSSTLSSQHTKLVADRSRDS